MKLRGYWYTRHSVCSSRVKWLCAETRHKQCHAIVVTIGCMTVDRQNKHTHPPLLNATRQTDCDFLQLLDKCSNHDIIITDRGNQLSMGGYRYGLRRQTTYKSWWRCVRHTKGCKSMAAMVDESVVYVKPHNHAPNKRSRNYRKVMFSKSRRGHTILEYQNNTYSLYSNTNGKQIWRCTKQSYRGCKARLVVVESTIVRANTEHHHGSGRRQNNSN